MLVELPENFGEMTQLKHLDLYANKVNDFFFMIFFKSIKEIYTTTNYFQISRLPLSLSELKHLKWLDLKGNPLTEAVARVAGPCNNMHECQTCAYNIVSYLSTVKIHIEKEKLRRLNNMTGKLFSV